MTAFNIVIENVEQINRMLTRLMGTDKDADIVLISEVQQAIVMGRLFCTRRDVQESIGIFERKPLEIVAGARAPFARELEWGNKYMAAKPYWCAPIWEAFFRIRRRIMDSIKEKWTS